MTTRHVMVGALATASFVVASVLRSWLDANPYLVTLFMLIGVVLGCWVAYSIMKVNARRT